MTRTASRAGTGVAERHGVGETNRSFVRVLGVRRATFVEFSFAHGDPDLSVELVLPYEAFIELCKRYDAETIPSEPEVAKAFAALATKALHRSQS